MSDCFVGVGLRTVHYPHISSKPKIRIKWFEAVSENYMDTKGRPFEVLTSLRRDFPVALHGVSMSIGSASGVSQSYLAKLKELINHIDPFIVSDHLCWAHFGNVSYNDLLPLPLTDETLSLVVNHIDFVQSYLGRHLLFENVSSYLTFKHSTYTEWDFLKEVVRRSGCKLLLDINNIYVNASNHRFDGCEFIDAIPNDYIGQVHMAGFTDMGTYYFDTHSKEVSDPVWNMYHRLIQRHPTVPVLLEWDEDIPSFEKLENEALKAATIWSSYHG